MTHDGAALGAQLQPARQQQQQHHARDVLREARRHLPGRGRARDRPPARPAHRALQGLQRVRQDQGHGQVHPVRARRRGRRADGPRQDGGRRRPPRGDAGLLRAAHRPLLQVHHAHAAAASSGLQAGQPAGGRHGHRRPPIRRRRDRHHRHLAALRAQRLPRGRQRRRHLPVRRLRLGRRSRPHPQRRVGPGAGLPDGRTRVHAGQGVQGGRRGHRFRESHEVLLRCGTRP